MHDAAAKRARSQTVAAAAALQQLRRATDEKMYSPRVLGTGDITHARYAGLPVSLVTSFTILGVNPSNVFSTR